jgi:hypothetical protein
LRSSGAGHGGFPLEKNRAKKTCLYARRRRRYLFFCKSRMVRAVGLSRDYGAPLDRLLVVKRDGSKQLARVEKIEIRLLRMCFGMDTRDMDLRRIAGAVFDHVRKVPRNPQDLWSTREIDALAVDVCAGLAELLRPKSVAQNYALLAGRIEIENIHKATLKSFSATMQRLADRLETSFLDRVRQDGELLDSVLVHYRDYDLDHWTLRSLKPHLLPGERPQHHFMRKALETLKGAEDVEAAIERYQRLSRKKQPHHRLSMNGDSSPNAHHEHLSMNGSGSPSAHHTGV